MENFNLTGLKISLLFQHGWAFSRRCWHDWESLLPAGTEVVYGCRGYFQPEEQRPHFAGRGRKIIVAHSLGAHLLDPGLLAAAELLVMIGGFRHLHGDEERDGVLSRRHLQRLRKRVVEDPDALVADFYRDCAAPFSPPAGGVLNRERLAADLERLDCSELDPTLLAAIPRVLLLHGRQDRIVSLRRAEQLHARLPNSSLAVLDEGGHGLPFTATGWCWGRIVDELILLPPAVKFLKKV